MGRLVAFLGRMKKEELVGATDIARGLGVGTATAVLLESNGQARVVGQFYAYFVTAPAKPKKLVVENKDPAVPLTLVAVNVVRVKAGGKSVFNFSTLAGLLEVDAKRYTVQVDKG